MPSEQAQARRQSLNLFNPSAWFKAGKHAINLKPAAGESPAVVLRLRVIGCSDLESSVDSFAAVSVLNNHQHTPVAKRSANPRYKTESSAFDFPLYLSLADKLHGIEIVIWNKDLLKKEYLGEASLSLTEWFEDKVNSNAALAFEHPGNESFSLNLVSTRGNATATGTVEIKLGFVNPPNTPGLIDYADVYNQLLQRSRPSILSAPPTEGIGTVRSNKMDGFPYEIADGPFGDEDEDDKVDFKSNSAKLALLYTPPSVDKDAPSESSNSTPKAPSHQPELSALSGPKSPITRVQNFSVSNTVTSSNSIVGLVMLEILGADHLPSLSNMTFTDWDVDPFVVIAFGKKVFRTRVIRHSLNPVWDEKLVFNVHRYETSFDVQLTVLDWDKISFNDLIGDAVLDVSELLRNAPQPDAVTGLYSSGEEEGGNESGMKDFILPLIMPKGVEYDQAQQQPQIRFRARYQPYDALRQRFWRLYLKKYDTDNTGTISYLELTSMLDSLGSTLTRSTVASFFAQHGKTREEDLTIDQAVLCLEAILDRPFSQRVSLNEAEDREDSVASAIPVVSIVDDKGEEIELEKLDFSEPIYADPPLSQPINRGNNSDRTAQVSGPNKLKKRWSGFGALGSPSKDLTATSSEKRVESIITIRNCPLCHRRWRVPSSAAATGSEIDLVTHLALCASKDWYQLDKILMAHFVTAAQAQKKWYSKLLSKLLGGEYKLGANSANTIVQNRLTGQLEEERMQLYVRIGIRLLYRGFLSQMESSQARRLLKYLSVKQGESYDDPESAKDIPDFIEYHSLNVDEVLEPLDSFKTFNAFFYRRLKPNARPVENPDDPNRLVSAADCRLITFDSIDEATQIWIKGRFFSIERLLGYKFGDEVDPTSTQSPSKSESEKEQREKAGGASNRLANLNTRLNLSEKLAKHQGGTLAIFRLAPQDYHRLHSPVDGRVVKVWEVVGDYYTVNPQAIRSALDIFGENARTVITIDSPQFGRVFLVLVGAMMVGSILVTVNEGDEVKRGDEVGYFAFGGSTIVALFEQGRVQWDEDLRVNSKGSLETLVRVGMGIGRF